MKKGGGGGGGGAKLKNIIVEIIHFNEKSESLKPTG